MKFGVASGALWGLDTVVLGSALLLAPFNGSSHAPLASAALHDASCAVILLVYMGLRGRLRDTARAIATRSGRAVALGALLGGPVGMSGYLLAIRHIGPSYTAIVSTLYPAVGTFLAFCFLGERMRVRQTVALLVALAAIAEVGWTSSAHAPGSALVGIVAAFACVLGWGSEAVILAWGMRDDCVDNETALHIRQTMSGLCYLVIVVPFAGHLGFVADAATSPSSLVLVCAALAGTASYLFYYKAIGTIGAARGMALNISYSAWAVIIAALAWRTPPTLIQMGCCVVILVCTVLAATPDWRDITHGSPTQLTSHSELEE